MMVTRRRNKKGIKMVKKLERRGDKSASVVEIIALTICNLHELKVIKKEVYFF